MTRLLAALLLSLALGCGGASPSGGGETSPLELTLSPKVRGMDERVLSLVVDVAGVSSRGERALRAWFRAGMAQGPYLDIDTATERADRIVLRGELDADGGTLTTTFVRAGATPVPLAGVRGVAGDDLVRAIDRLCLETRITLGEPADSVRAHSRSAAALVSGFEAVAAACADAQRLVAKGRLPQAEAVLRRALRTDASCALALSLAAGTAMDLGNARAATMRAQRVAALPERASREAQHRADRVLLLATRQPPDSLIALAEQAAAERPRDPQIRFTKALGLCLANRYAQALPLLEALAVRLPDSPGVLFCLGHALLGTGAAERARALLPRIESRVPPLPAGRLAAYTLFALGDHAQLEQHLANLARQPELRRREGKIALLGMQAAHLIVQKKDAAAAGVLLDRLDRLRGAPSLLESRGDLLVDTAWSMARLGRARECAELLASLRGKRGLPETARASGMVADAICRLATGAKLAPERLRHLESAGLRAWRFRLEAAGALKAGDPSRAILLLNEASKESDDPSLVLEYAEALRAAGRVADSDDLLKKLRDALALPRLAEPGRHALVRPHLAITYRSSLE